MDIKEARLVIFDMDGVVFDSEKTWERLDACADGLFNTGFDKSVRFACCGRDEKSIRAYLRSLKPDLDVDAYRDHIINGVAEAEKKNGAPLKDGFIELAERLKADGKKIALATSSRRDRAEMLFRRAGLDMCELFDAISTREDVAFAKPDPQIFMRTAELSGVKPSETVVLEDSPNGLNAAYNGGFTPIMVLDLIPPPPEFIARGMTVINSLRELL